MAEVKQEYLRSREAAQYLGMAYDTLKHQYPSWINFGVIPIRMNGKENTGKLRFKRTELDAMMEKWRVVKE